VGLRRLARAVRMIRSGLREAVEVRAEASVSDGIGGMYFDHLARHFGMATRRSVFQQQPSSPSVQILEYDHVMAGCRLFATLGLTHFRNGPAPWSELFTIADAEWNTVPQILSTCAFFADGIRLHVERGIAIRFERTFGEFVSRTGKVALYVTEPFGELARTFVIEPTRPDYRLLCGIFISAQEYDLFVGAGWEEFEGVLERAAVDPFELGRESVC